MKITRVFILGMICIFFSSCKFIVYDKNDLRFLVKNKTLELSGRLSFPENFDPNGKFVIIVPQILEYDDNMYASIAQELCRNGIACLQYKNRAKEYPMTENSVTLNSEVEDLSIVIDCIRNNKRLKSVQIGLLGYKDGSYTAVVEASKNANVSFLALLSTLGTSGYEQAMKEMDEVTSLSIMRIGDLDLELTDEAREFVLEGARNELTVVYKYRDPDSIKKYLNRLVEVQYNSKYNDFFFRGKTLEDAYINNYSMVKSQRLVEEIRYDPKDYFGTIHCPVMATYSHNGYIDHKKNKERLEQLFVKLNKDNYKFDLVNNFLMRDSSKTHPPIKYNVEAWGAISDWINSLDSI